MKYDYDDNGDIRSDQRVSLGYAQQLLSNGATPEQVGAIFGNSTLKEGLTTLDYAAGKLSDAEASDRAVAYLNELQAGQSTASGGARESSDIGLVITPNRDSPSGESILGGLLSGGLGVIHGLDELYSNPLTEGLANLAYSASKVVLGGGPLKTVAYQLGKVAVSSSLDRGVAYLSGQAQTITSSYVSDLAARNGLSVDVTFAGQTHVLGAEQFGDVAGLLVGSVVNTVLGGAITGVTDRAGQVSNIVSRRKGIYEFPDKAAGDIPYVGQSSNVENRLKQHQAAGRLEPGTAIVTDVAGSKTAREIAEHLRIQEITRGVPARLSPNVSNKVDPIGPKRQDLLNN